MLSLVVLDLGDDPLTFDVEVVSLDPGLPVLALPMPRQSLFVGPDALLFVFRAEVVRDIAPCFDLAKPRSCVLC